jgi:4-amino-4-deoxy-L-arabinose transferase-like glycosyltransferase
VATASDLSRPRSRAQVGSRAGDSRRVWLLVGAITLIGLLLRLPSFGDSLFGDEVGAYWIVTARSFGQVIHLLSGHSPELNPPFWFVLAWVSEKLFGNSAGALKLVSLLAGTATIPLTYVLGRITLSVRAGVVAAALVALSPFLIFYSTEARPYAVLVLLCVLSTIALVCALRTRDRRWWGLYALFACGVAYTHFTGVFLLGAQFLWALIAYPRARRALVVSTAAGAIGFLPWLPNLIRTARSPGTKLYGVLEPFGLHAIRIDLGHWAIGHPYIGLATLPGGFALLLLGAGIVVAVVAVAVRLASEREAIGVRREQVLVVVVACAAPVGIAIYSELRESVWEARNLVSSLPGFALLVAWLLTAGRAPLRYTATALVIVGLAIGGVKLSEAAHQRPDYKSAAAYIDQIDRGRAPVVDLAALSPGPPTATEAALALDRPADPRPVLRIGIPPIDVVLAHPPYTSLPALPGGVVARQAAAIAGNGTMFIVAPTGVPVSRLEATRRQHTKSTAPGSLARFAEFLGALPKRFHPVTSRTFPGFLPVTVYLYRG